MPPKRITEAWEIGNEHRKDSISHRNRAYILRGIAGAQLLVLCSGSVRQSCGGRIALGWHGVGMWQTSTRKEILASLSKSLRFERHSSSGTKCAPEIHNGDSK